MTRDPASRESHDRPLPSPEAIAALPRDGGPEFNRLIHAQSPYLLQHARNPVDWYPWGPEAFEAAKRRNVPIFLSVGYSTCHWCHVMGHESFEHPDVAAILNAHFVPVKVDREERPDVDEIHMNVTQLLTRHGGWPNSVWLTPDGRPFFAGTYFPREDQGGRPGFQSVLRQVASWWENEHDRVVEQADEITSALRRMATGKPLMASGQASRDLVGQAMGELRQTFDSENGGFGTRPKFPPHGALNLLLHEYERTGNPELLSMLTRTLDAMRLGGIHDHVGGGFARYSTDEAWFLPHFEKMLYDNAQLARVYAEAWRLTGQPAFRRTAERTYAWVLRDLRSPEGAFYSAYDADSEGEEGKFYLWRRAEILALLGEAEGDLVCRVFQVTEDGNYREEATGHRPGSSILHLARPLPELAARERLDPDVLSTRLDAALETLRKAREKRVKPHLDDKVLTSWNGLMIGSLARGGQILERPDLVQAAAEAASFLLTNLRRDGRLLRTWRAGEARLNAYLDDYTFLAHGLLDLHEATGEPRWRAEAEALMGVVEEWFADLKNGGYYFTSHDHETLLTRSRNAFDAAIPSGNGQAALTLVRLAGLTGRAVYRKRADRVFDAFLGLIQRAPRATESLLLALALFHDTLPAEPAEDQAGTRTAPADATAFAGPVKVDAFLARTRITPGHTLPAALRITVDPGWHLNAHKPGLPHLTPTRVTLGKHPHARLGSIEYPTAHEFQPAEGEPIRVYEGEIVLAVPVEIADTAPVGPLTLTLQATLQACDDQRCLKPHQVRLDLTVEVASVEIAAGADDTDENRHPGIFGPLANR